METKKNGWFEVRRAEMEYVLEMSAQSGVKYSYEYVNSNIQKIDLKSIRKFVLEL